MRVATMKLGGVHWHLAILSIQFAYVSCQYVTAATQDNPFPAFQPSLESLHPVLPSQ